jgi:O-antigen/teichoic acid export membrane protein
LKSFIFLAKSLKSRFFGYATTNDSPFFTFLSPAIVSLRLSDGFVRNVFVLMGGSTFAMVIPVLASPVLTRLYSPNDYGIFALFVSIVTACSVLVTGGYDTAVVLPKRDRDALNVMAVCVTLSLVLGVVLLLISWLASGYADELSGSRISVWLPWVSLSAFVIGLQQTFSFWANRKRQFRTLAANRVVESVATPGINVGLGVCSFGVGGLVMGLLAGKIIATSLLARSLWRDKNKWRPSFQRQGMLKQVIRYRDFPFFFAPTSFLDVLALQVPVLLLAKFFGPTVVGLFALSTRVIGAPLALLSSCVGQVYYQWMAEASHRKENASYVFRIAFYLLLIVAGPLLIIVLFSPSLFSVIFGEEWRTAGEYARILMVPLAAKFVVSPLTVIMPASGNIRLGSIWKVVYFLSTSITLYIASHFNVKTFLYVYCVHDVVLYTISFLLVLRASSHSRAYQADVRSAVQADKIDRT